MDTSKKLVTLLLISLFAILSSGYVGATESFKFRIIDASLDKLDPLKAYSRLKDIIDVQKDPNRFVADGCSGEISKTWDEVIYPRFIRPKLPPEDQHQAIPFPAHFCCLKHDKSYHRAALVKNNASSAYKKSPRELLLQRKLSDRKFRTCIAQEENEESFIENLALILSPEGSPPEVIQAKKKKLEKTFDVKDVADLMYFGVRFGGRPCSNHHYRFGYGYLNCKDAGRSTLDTAFKVILDLIESSYN